MKFFVLLSCIALTILSCGCTNPVDDQYRTLCN